MVIGAYAVGAHGHPRATKDFDLWVDANAENAGRVFKALKAFGAPLHDVSESDFAQPGVVFQMGVPPGRIDIVTQISGVSFADAWPRRFVASLDGVELPVIGFDDLVANKRASGREQDRLDVARLEQLRKLKG